MTQSDNNAIVPHPHQSSGGLASESLSLTELQRENARLKRLVAELLLKNQELRKAD